MQIPDRCDPLAAISRRGLLKSVATLSAMAPAAAQTRREAPVLAYVGTYTNHGEGIYLFQMDPRTGALTQVKVFKGISNPSWLAIHPSQRFLYAGNEDFTPNDTVSAFAVDPSNGDLTLLNIVSAQGSGPAHLSVHPSGRFVLVANYGSGNVAVLRVLSNGALGSATDVKSDASACVPGPCPLGPTRAQNAPPGSFAISGHDAPHAHMIESDPEGNFVLVNDLGLDRTLIWKFDREAGTLSEPKTVASSPGAGPRHFAFHPNGRWFYSLNEEASTLAFMIYNPRNGSLLPVKEISTLPPQFVGTNFTSEVIVSRDGRFVYAANRLHDTIAIFSIDDTGAPTLRDEVWTRGDYPRNINIDPTGNFMYACNHRSDAITTFRIDGGGRHLRFTGQYTAAGSPAIIIFPARPGEDRRGSRQNSEVWT